MTRTKTHAGIALGMLGLLTATALGTPLLSGSTEEAPAPGALLFSSVAEEERARSEGRGDPVIVASGEGILVRETNLPGHTASTDVRTSERGRIVVPPGHVAYFRVNLSVEPVAPVRLVVSVNWDPHEGERYAPVALDFFRHSRAGLESDWAVANCVLPEGTFRVRAEGPLKESHPLDPPRPAVLYAWEGEGHLGDVGPAREQPSPGLRCWR